MADTGHDAASGWTSVPIPVPAAGRSASFEMAGRRVLLCNVAGTPYAIENLCPHVRVPLDGGRLVGPVLQCPEHGGKIDVRDGSPAARPIRRAAVVFRLRQNGGVLEIDLGATPEETACTTS